MNFIDKNNPDVYWLTKDNKKIGHGFMTDNGIYLQRCPQCQRENYVMAVATGLCAWCNFDANEFNIK